MLRCFVALRCALMSSAGLSGGANHVTDAVATCPPSSSTELQSSSLQRDMLSWNALSPDELASRGHDLGAMIRSSLTISPFDAMRIMNLFVAKKIRHEGVLYAAAWKAFKAPLPPHSSQPLTPTQLQDIQHVTNAVSATFQLVAQQRLVNDHQLLVLAVTKSVECTPAMTAVNVSQTMSALKHLGRLTLSVAEAENYSSNLEAANVLRDPLLADVPIADSFAAADAQRAKSVDLMDVLSSALEDRIVELGSSAFRSQDILSCVESMSKIGVSRKDSIATLADAAARTPFAMHEMASLLSHALDLHQRVLDVLEHSSTPDDVDDPENLGSLCRPLFVCLAQRLTDTNVAFVAHQCPQLIVNLRRLCEKSTSLTTMNDVIPQLWDKIRCVKVSHQHSIKRSDGTLYKHGTRARLKGKLGALPAVPKKKEHDMAKLEMKDRFVPPQYKGWKGNKTNQRHLLAPKVSRVARFGTQRIQQGYIKGLQKKHLKDFY